MRRTRKQLSDLRGDASSLGSTRKQTGGGMCCDLTRSSLQT